MESHARNATVIGAGVGGLATALALHQRGLKVTVHERAGSLDPVGSGISLAPNALRALDTLGVGDRLRALAAPPGEAGLRRPSGRRLALTSSSGIERTFGDPIVVLPRAALVDVLLAQLPDGTVRTSSEIAVVHPGDEQQPATLSTGEPADLVVAADGLRSRTRALLFPDHEGPRYAGCTTWRTIVPGRPVPAGETWGRGALTGVFPLAEGRVYLYAAAWTAPGGQAPDHDERAELLRRFGTWHAPLPQLLASAQPEQVLRHDVWELATPLPALHHGRVALLGDAAHAMTPFQGQGACQAVEDAVVLAHHFQDLPGYTASRLPRTTHVATRSRRTARLVALNSLPATTLRDATLALAGRLPERTLLRSAARVLDWRPPGR